jgi:CDP-glycerol glycerophosphotransferase
MVFTRNKPVEILGALNVEQYNIYSLKGIWALCTCHVIYIQHTVTLDYGMPWKYFCKKILSKNIGVNLWHGIAVKKIRASLPNCELFYEHDLFKIVVSSSKLDKLVMTSAFYPIKHEKVKVTGLPRNDFLLLPEKQLPPAYLQQLEKIASTKKDKKLIVYAPTFRDSGLYYPFSAQEITILKEILKRNNAILGFRVHYFHFKNNNKYLPLIDNEVFFDLGQNVIQDMNMLIRKTDVLITDYSSSFVDAMLLDKPMICFAYDFQDYSTKERGFYHNFETIFPGKILQTSEQLFNEINLALNSTPYMHYDKLAMSKALFFDFNDNNNSKRVIDEVLKFA